jgi:Fe-S-cluster-containing dehydrogenase component
MKKWNLIIDINKCSDCNNCFLACKDEHVDNDFKGYTMAQPRHGHRWINIKRKERGWGPLIDVSYLPVPCMHCDDAPCIKNSKEGVVYKRKDGIVMIDQQRAIGKKEIVKSCPYGSIWWNQEKNVAQKCTLCAHLLDDGWKAPRCVQACPNGALRMVQTDEQDMKNTFKSEKLAVYRPDFKTQPRVFYKNLHRYTECFIAGSIAFKNNEISDCAEGAAVNLIKDTKKLEAVITDNYGDFKFDSLPEDSGAYGLEITYKNYGKKNITVELKKSIYLGDIYLDDMDIPIQS